METAWDCSSRAGTAVFFFLAPQPLPRATMDADAVGCPVCHETGSHHMHLFPCAHSICDGCLPQLRSEASVVKCPQCRASCPVDHVQPHEALAMLSAVHHCSGCRAVWDDDAHKPMVLRPCLDQVCRTCAKQATCPVCATDISGKVEDDAFHASLVSGDIPRPGWELLPPQPPQPETLEAALIALCAWLEVHPEIFTTDWDLYLPQHLPSVLYGLYDECMQLCVRVGRAIPIPAMLSASTPTPFTICTALNPGPLKGMLLVKIQNVYDVRSARKELTPEVQNAMARLPWHHALV